MSDRSTWWPFLAGCFAFFTIMSGATIPTPLYPLYADRFGFSPFVITLIFAAYSAGVIAALLGTGPWSDEIGRKPLLLGGLGTTALAAIAFTLADGLTMLLLARALQGFAVGIYASTATVAVTELAPEGQKRIGGFGATAANMGGLGGGAIIGGIVITLAPAPLVTPYLVHLAMAGLSLLALWWLPEPGERSPDPQLRAQGLAVPEEVRGIFVPSAIAAFAIFMICGFLGSVAPKYLGDVFGRQGDHILIGVVAGLIFLTSILGQWVEDMLPDRVVLPLGMATMTLGIAAITATLASQTLPGFVAAIAFAGIGHGIAFRGGLVALSSRAPQGQAAAVTATYFTIVYVAISVPVLIIGALQGPLGLVPMTIGYAIFSTLLSALALGLILRRG